MAVRDIIIAPDPRLKAKSEPVESVDDEVRTLMDDLLDTMYMAPGIGLSAPQVGVLKRVIVVDAAKDPDNRQPHCLANPEILWASEELLDYEEGCLSLPEHYAEVTRPDRIRVRYLDRENEIREMDAEGLLATCIQHEMDHLEGVLFVDHLTRLKREVILRKLRKAKKLGELESAPAKPRIALKMAITTGIALVLTAAIRWVVQTGWIDLRPKLSP